VWFDAAGTHVAHLLSVPFFTGYWFCRSYCLSEFLILLLSWPLSLVNFAWPFPKSVLLFLTHRIFDHWHCTDHPTIVRVCDDHCRPKQFRLSQMSLSYLKNIHPCNTRTHVHTRTRKNLHCLYHCTYHVREHRFIFWFCDDWRVFLSCTPEKKKLIKKAQDFKSLAIQKFVRSLTSCRPACVCA
jgi:hypothetical protein